MTDLLWKISTGIFAAAMLVASTGWMSAVGEKAALQTKLKRSESSLATCTADKQTLAAGLDKQNQAIRDLGDINKQTMASVKASLDALRRDSAARQSQISDLLRPLTAATTCERVQEVDARFMKTLK